MVGDNNVNLEQFYDGLRIKTLEEVHQHIARIRFLPETDFKRKMLAVLRYGVNILQGTEHDRTFGNQDDWLWRPEKETLSDFLETVLFFKGFRTGHRSTSIVCFHDQKFVTSHEKIFQWNIIKEITFPPAQVAVSRHHSPRFNKPSYPRHLKVNAIVQQPKPGY